MAGANIVDELVVQLTLDAQPYQEAERKINREADRTARQQTERARQTERRDRDQQKRIKDVGSDVRGFMRSVAGAATVVAGLGAAFGASLVNLLGFETGLRRQTVGTALSNREMQAWGATARRLGADAQAGADAIAGLAKERQQFELTGQAPTMQALARLGVNTNKNIPIQDVLAQAQQIYRAAPAGQQQQIENSLSAQGVSSDLILMIKSERDAREVFSQSFAQASEENRKALDQLADSLESMKAQAISITSTLLTAFQPALEVGAEKLGELATNVAAFANEVTEAGGGVNAFQAALDKNVPSLGYLFEGFRLEAKLLSEAVTVFTSDFRRAGAEIAGIWQRVSNFFSLGTHGAEANKDLRKLFGVKDGVSWGQHIAMGLSDMWGGRVASAGRSSASNPYGLPANIEDVGSGGLPRNIENDGASGGAQGLMTKLITQYGVSVQDAAAIVANWQAESGLNPAAYNPAGGGTGARGIAQWRGDRTKRFQARYGVTPDRASIDQQIEFAMRDPFERALLDKSLAAGGTAAAKGRSVSQRYEAHGNVGEDIRRGSNAQRLADDYAANNPANVFNIQNMTVQANQPAELAGGLQRISGSQNYNSVQR